MDGDVEVLFGNFTREETLKLFGKRRSLTFPWTSEGKPSSLAEPEAASLSDAGLQRSSPQSPAAQQQSAVTKSDGQSATLAAVLATPTSSGNTDSQTSVMSSAPATSAWAKGGPSFASLFANVQQKAPSGKGIPPHSVNFPSQPPAPPGLLDNEPYKPVTLDEDHMAKKLADTLHQLHQSLDFNKVAILPRGLINRGSLCYIHAPLQALLSCAPLCHLLQSLPAMSPRDRGASCTPMLDALVQFAHEFEVMDEKEMPKPAPPANGQGKKSSADLKHGTAFEPLYVYDVLNKIKTSLSVKGKQEDAEEFFSCLVNSLHEEMLRLLSVANQGETEGTAEIEMQKKEKEDADDNGEEWEQVGPKNKSVITRSPVSTGISPISSIFGGEMRSSILQQGLKESATVQPFFTLPLDIQSEKVWSVKDALDQLAFKETLHGFTCDKTKMEVEASKRITLSRLPPVLILHLKRFVFDKTGGSQKLQKEVDCPFELEIGRDLLAPSLRGQCSPLQRKYSLTAVVFHHGKKATGGHYTCDAFHPAISGWLRADDNHLKVVSESQVSRHISDRVPYLLFYCQLASA